MVDWSTDNPWIKYLIWFFLLLIVLVVAFVFVIPWLAKVLAGNGDSA